MLDATTMFFATGFKQLIVKKILVVLTHCRSGFNLVEIQTDLGSKRIVTIINKKILKNYVKKVGSAPHGKKILRLRRKYYGADGVRAFSPHLKGLSPLRALTVFGRSAPT